MIFSPRKQRELSEALTESVRQSRELRDELAHMKVDYEHERTRRISAETMAVERLKEVGRLSTELKETRDMLNSVVSERLKSLDALNTRILADRAEPPPPDMSKFKVAEKLAGNAIANIRRLHHDMDTAILTKLDPRFAKMLGKGVKMDQPMTEEAV